jgi:hypothetical protein
MRSINKIHNNYIDVKQIGEIFTELEYLAQLAHCLKLLKANLYQI